MKISGLTIVRNAISNGYLIAEVIDTLAAIADEVVVCDGFSTDGTFEYLQSRQDIKLYQDNWNLQSENGLEFAKITDLGINRCTGDFVFYLQADELIHENEFDNLKNLILSNQYNSIACNFYHIRYDFDYCLTGGYEQAIRIIRNNGKIFSHYDAYDFYGDIHPRHQSNIAIYHFGYVFLENILAKMINHSKYFYTSAINYRQRSNLAHKYLEQIAAGEQLNPLDIQQHLEPMYQLRKHGLSIPSCVERLRHAKKYTLPESS